MNELISLEKIAQWQKLKTLVLDSVSSPIPTDAILLTSKGENEIPVLCDGRLGNYPNKYPCQP